MLFILRIAQGISYGGELSGAIVLVSEHVEKRKGLFCSLVLFFAACGIVVANLTYGVLNSFLTPEQMMMYGWRIAFIFGGIVIFHSYFARKGLYESETYLRFQRKTRNINNYNPLFILFKEYKIQLILGMLMISGTVIYTGICEAYLPTYLAYFKLLPQAQISSLLIIMATCVAIGCLLGGWISDIIGVVRSYLLFTLASLALSYPAFYFLQIKSDIMLIYFLMGALALTNGLLSGVYMRYIADSFPVHIRYSCLAIITGLTFSILVGFSPLVLNETVTSPDYLMFPAWLLFSFLIIQAIAILLFEFSKKMKVREVLI
jgi:MHS family proline/betaine transporter-like MFS transporter